jgi:transposase InsO family protein
LCLLSIGIRKKQPFHSSNRISGSPLQLIHSNIWTSPIFSLTGFKYYAAFIDDYSRFTWIYPIHHKSETFYIFTKFKLLVENQFSTKIKQLQSNRGSEYTSLQFQSFLAQHGIALKKNVSLHLSPKWSCRKKAKTHPRNWFNLISPCSSLQQILG